MLRRHLRGQTQDMEPHNNNNEGLECLDNLIDDVCFNRVLVATADYCIDTAFRGWLSYITG